MSTAKSVADFINISDTGMLCGDGISHCIKVNKGIEIHCIWQYTKAFVFEDGSFVTVSAGGAFVHTDSSKFRGN